MFEAPSDICVPDIVITIFQCPILQTAITKNKIKYFLFKPSPSKLLIILHQLTKFEATSY